MRILLLNAGSSSLKCTVTEAEGRAVVATALFDWAGAKTHYERRDASGETMAEELDLRSHGEAVERVLVDWGFAAGAARRAGCAMPGAVGHRVVHGGEFMSSVRISDDVRDRIAALAELAPLHNPPSLETLDAASRMLPDVPHVAVFDTAFHATMPAAARTYALPESWRRDWGIRRYGFHGLSHSYAAARAAELLERDAANMATVVCHLGHGCSATAVLGGRSIDTTMGFTPLDGLMMATRSGSVDPGIVTHLQLRRGLTAHDVEWALNRRSGLLGVSGVSADMREVLAAASAGHDGARLAIDTYAHRVRQAVGALAVTLGRLDALVFTAGVGENAPAIRGLVCRGLECLGVELDGSANERRRPDANIASRASKVPILVVAAREDLAMLDEVLRAIA